MTTGWRTRLRRSARPEVVGALAAVTMAGVVYSQFNLYAAMSRDTAIYMYGGQRLTHGVPPYASIMDPKGPIPGILCGFGIAVARLFGRNELFVTRAEFCALSVLGVLGIYLLVLELFHSVVAAVAAAAVFVSFKPFAFDALGGPNGHTPGIVFVIFALWLTVSRRWYWAGFAASLAFCSWQPLFTYPLVALLCAVVWSPGRRWRAAAWNVAGASTPVVMLIIYYAATGYLANLFEGLFVFPVVGVYRPPMTLGHRVRYIFDNVTSSFGFSAVLLAIGLALLLFEAGRTVMAARPQWRSALTSPLILLVLLSLVVQVAYVFSDYIGPSHAFPLLPYAALGFGAGVARVLALTSSAPRRRYVTAALATAAVALTTVCAIQYYQPSDDSSLLGERASACAIQSSLAPRTTLWVIDDPSPLVLLHRRNPDNYPYVGSGLAVWKVKHTAGGFASWTSQIKAKSSVVVLDSWREWIPIRRHLLTWLRTNGYRKGYIGTFRVYVTPAAQRRMAAQSIRLTPNRGPWPLTTTGGTFRTVTCRQGR